MRKIFFALVLLAVCLGRSAAQTQEFAFALPELEGRISLGVLDARGVLVRTLCVGASDADFKIGLNGLITRWDGRDDAGTLLPAGKYTVRGYVVGTEVKTEGVAFHFNDWIDDEASPRITRIRDFQKLPGGFVLAADTVRRVQTHPGSPPGLVPQTEILRYDEVRGFVWRNVPDPVRAASALPDGLPLPVKDPPDGAIRGGDVIALMGSLPTVRPLVAVTADYAIAAVAGSIRVMKISDGADVHHEPLSGTPVLSLDAVGGAAYVEARGLSVLPLPQLAPLRSEETPAAFASIAVHGGEILGADAGEPGFWLRSGKTELRIPAGIRATSVSFGVDRTIWATGTLADTQEDATGQFDRDGAFLRSYRSEFAPRKVDASQEIEEIAVLEEAGGAQRLRVLKLADAEGATARGWEIVFEKTLHDCLRFGIVDGALAADAGNAEPDTRLTLFLASGGLTASSHALKAKIIAGPDGLWLVTADGLRLFRIAEQTGVYRVAVQADAGRSATVYAGNGAAVAEYLVTGLGNIAEIEVGEIEIP
ncbi:MAG TPA: FlgD immunoglobulin-like domain containing protein [Terrimicrobiaceae bacterium]|nr:FlgD immunoglobulin-like domain containing protein [Terrimicrobiaceae bacterium]